MKTILKLSLVVAVLLSSFNTYAINGEGEFGLHVLKGNGRTVTFALNQTKKATISIYDKEGTILYSENASGKDGILRTFNLEEFPEGSYLLEVQDGTKKIQHIITVTEDASIISTKAISTVYKTDAKNTSVAVR